MTNEYKEALETMPNPFTAPDGKTVKELRRDLNSWYGENYETIRTALMDDEWQLIESAPKDGTAFLVRHCEHSDESINICYYQNNYMYLMNDGSGYAVDTKLFPAYTHWKPLPPKGKNHE